MFLQNICIKWKISVILYYFDYSTDKRKLPTCDDYFFYCCCGSRDRHAESFPMPILGEGILWPSPQSSIFKCAIWIGSVVFLVYRLFS